MRCIHLSDLKFVIMQSVPIHISKGIYKTHFKPFSILMEKKNTPLYLWYIYICRYNIVTRKAEQLMLPPGNCEANENDVERYCVKIVFRVWNIHKCRKKRSMSSCCKLLLQQKEIKGASVLLFIQFASLFPCNDTLAKYFAESLDYII